MCQARLPFTAAALRRVPSRTGVYFLFRDHEPVCAGVASGGASLRSELAARLKMEHGVNRATHFNWIETGDPLTAYRLQLAAYACIRAPDRPPAASC